MKVYNVKINADLFVKELNAKNEEDARNKILSKLDKLDIQCDVMSMDIVETKRREKKKTN